MQYSNCTKRLSLLPSSILPSHLQVKQMSRRFTVDRTWYNILNVKPSAHPSIHPPSINKRKICASTIMINRKETEEQVGHSLVNMRKTEIFWVSKALAKTDASLLFNNHIRRRFGSGFLDTVFSWLFQDCIGQMKSEGEGRLVFVQGVCCEGMFAWRSSG